jgi:hypothetical protein
MKKETKKIEKSIYCKTKLKLNLFYIIFFGSVLLIILAIMVQKLIKISIYMILIYFAVGKKEINEIE